MSTFPGKTVAGRVVSVHAGSNADLSKQAATSLQAEIGGFSGDKHQGATRKAWKGEPIAEGTVRRNERQWSGVSVEELKEIGERLELVEALEPATVGANLCFEGIADFSLLPRGTRLVFASGAVLSVEEYNPPCAEMGAQIAAVHATRSGRRLEATDWLRPAAGRRGVVGVVDVPGAIGAGDEVTVYLYEEPRIRRL